MTDELVIRRRTLGSLEFIGRGGTAAVYGLPDLRPESLGVEAPQGLAYKEYSPKTRARAGPGLAPGLQAMVGVRSRLAPAQRARWDERVIWPVRLVVDDHGAATGIVMPLIPQRFFQRVTPRSGGVMSVPREAEKLFGDVETMERIGVAPVTQEVRVRLIGCIAATYALMHYAEVVIGDISGRNLVYDPDPVRPAVLAYDADSARLTGSRSPFGSQPHTPRWEPPEALAAARRHRESYGTVHPDAIVAQSKSTDVYKFGLLVVRILDYGKGRAVNRDPAAATRVLRRAGHERAARLLVRSLAEQPGDRPTLREWYEALRRNRAVPNDLPPRPGGPEAPRGSTGPRGTKGPHAPEDPPPAETERLVDGTVIGSWVFRAESGWHRRDG
ncbi:hypothetical protein [Micromonospora sp. NPDC005305]|uniref:hypothetical protein n=1 Tax=Micromonospora sp. NPDC005305 TaxID=3156875 RepID=UPI0033B6C9AA